MERVTCPKVDADPRLIEAEQAHRVARDEVLNRHERAQTGRLATYGRIFGTGRVFRNRDAYLSTNPSQRTMSATHIAKNARAEAELLRSLTPADAVARIEQARAAETAREEARGTEQDRANRYDYRQDRLHTFPQVGPSRGL